MQAALELIQEVESVVLDPNSLCKLGEASLCQGLSFSICKKKSWTRCCLRVFGVTLILGVCLLGDWNQAQPSGAPSIRPPCPLLASC